MAPNAQLVSTLSIFRASCEKKKKKGKKVKTQFFGRIWSMQGGYSAEDYDKVTTTVGRVLLHPHCRPCIVARRSIENQAPGRMTPLPQHPPAHSPQKSTLNFTLKPWLFGKPSSCSRRVMYVRSMQRKGLFPGLISMVLQTEKKENSVWMHTETVGSGLTTAPSWKISNESTKQLLSVELCSGGTVTMGLKLHYTH